MRLNNISFPHPVLGVSDDVYPLLDNYAISIDGPISDGRDYEFHVHLRQYNDKISSLIASGKAEYVCEVDCQRTYLRKCYQGQDAEIIVKFGQKNVYGRVEFNTFVTAKESFVYTNENFNEDYKGYSFQLEPGDIIVAFPPAHYNVSLKYDKLYAVGSFMQMVDGGSGTTETWFNLDGDKINIMLSHDMYEQYSLINNETNFMEIIHSSIVFNALVYAMYFIGQDEYKDKLWADAIRTRLQTDNELIAMNLDIESTKDAYKIAQAILKNPYKRLFNRLNIIKSENIGGEME